MTMKLVQKRFLKGSREFEIVDDAVYVCIKSFFKEEKLTVDLSTLDPDPVINESELEFFSPHRGRAIFSLLINNPNAGEFSAFVDTLKQKISGDDNSGSVELVSPETAQSALDRNVYEEPPEFVESDNTDEKAPFKPVNTERVDNDITMLKTYLGEEGIKPLLDSLEALKADPENEAAFDKVMDAFNDLGIKQGAVLTYATYLKALISKAVHI